MTNVSVSPKQGRVCRRAPCLRDLYQTDGDQEKSRSAAVFLLSGQCVVSSFWFCFHCGLSSLNSCYNLSVQAETHLQTEFYSTLSRPRPELGTKRVHLSPDQLKMDDDRCFTSLEAQQLNSAGECLAQKPS